MQRHVVEDARKRAFGAASTRLPNRKIDPRATLGDPFSALTGTNVSTNLAQQHEVERCSIFASH
jgi:hypothetical protein